MYPATLALAFLASSLSIVSAQSVDPSTVPQGTKRTNHARSIPPKLGLANNSFLEQWCNSQLASCPLLCLQITPTDATQANGCDTTTLTYSCICSDGQQPNASEYSQTLPYFLCTEQNNNCVNNCGQGDSACQTACRNNNPCGAQSPTRVNVTSSSASATATQTGDSAASTVSGTAVYTGFGGAASTGSAGSGSSSSSGSTGSSNAAVTLLNIGQVYGLGVVATGLFAGFSLLL